MKAIFPVILCAPLLLSACAKKPPPRPVDNDRFVTNIKASGAKIFRFTLVTAPAKKADKKGNGQRRQGRGNPEQHAHKNAVGNSGQSDHYRKKLDKLYSRLEQKLTETQYCREGFIEIDTYEAPQHIYLLGECNESATEQDIQNFANTYRDD